MIWDESSNDYKFVVLYEILVWKSISWVIHHPFIVKLLGGTTIIKKNWKEK